MRFFRKLSGNIFFKIILAFVALTFVFFGISGFLVGNPNSWVVKVGNTTVGQNAFIKALQNDRAIITASNNSPEALKYLESEQFQSAVLGRLTNRILIEKLRDEFGVSANKDLIMKSIANDPSFKNTEGKFDYDVFKRFLAKNGFNEEKYINEISNNIIATMIVQTIPLVAPVNQAEIVELEKFNQERRVADIVTISKKSLAKAPKPSDLEIQKFFDENKQNYAAPEMRKISYLHFSEKDFSKDFSISDAEILAEYEKNKENYLKPEARIFYHLLFDEKSKAEEFAQELAKSEKSKQKTEFVKLAKNLQNKDEKSLKLVAVKQDLIPELAKPIFEMSLGQISPALESSLGFHIFLLTEIKKPQAIPFSELKLGIKEAMLLGRKEKVLQAKTAEISDALLTSNSILEVAKKFNLKAVSSVVIDASGKNEKGIEVDAEKKLQNFAENAFLSPKGQTSKIFYAANSEGSYALKVEEIFPAHDRELKEIKSLILADLEEKLQSQALWELSQKVGSELKSNPKSMSDIISKYGLKLEKNREFPHASYMNFQGRQIPYKNPFLEELFAIKIDQATNVIPASKEEFIVGILRKVNKISASDIDANSALKKAEESLKNEILQEFNNYIIAKNPVKINDAFFSQKEAAK